MFAENRDADLPENGETENGAKIFSYQNSSSAKTRHPMELLFKQNTPFASFPKGGDLISGKVLEKKGNRLFVDLGTLGTGIVYGREYSAAQDFIKNLKSGDEISAKIVETDNDEGYVELSLHGAGDDKNWLDLKRMFQEGEVLELEVKKANSGGLVLELFGVEGFLPASQLSVKNYPRVGAGEKEKIAQELQKLIGAKLKVKILDLDPSAGKLIFTEKGLDSEALRKALEKYKVGDAVEGIITGVVDFGAFVKFDEEAGLEGLVHISEIDWTLIENPKTILKVGDKVRAKIIDMRGGRVSLSLKALKDDPWLKIFQVYRKGDLVRGKVTKFNPFGAFVELESKNGFSGIQGLAHISEFGSESRMRKEIELGKTYDFKILLVDPAEHKMSLGMMREKTEEPVLPEAAAPES